MMARLFAIVFTGFAIAFWDDENFRRLNIVMANIWWAAAFISDRLEKRT